MKKFRKCKVILFVFITFITSSFVFAENPGVTEKIPDSVPDQAQGYRAKWVSQDYFIGSKQVEPGLNGYVVLDEEDSSEIYAVNRDGTGLTKVTQIQTLMQNYDTPLVEERQEKPMPGNKPYSRIINPRWSPDEKSLIYGFTINGETGIGTIDIK